MGFLNLVADKYLTSAAPESEAADSETVLTPSKVNKVSSSSSTCTP